MFVTCVLRNWRQILSPDDWQSTILSREEVLSQVQDIWDTYISSSGSYQICLPAKILCRTENRYSTFGHPPSIYLTHYFSCLCYRIALIHIYGRECFQEAAIDPRKTIEKDVLPRFIASPFFDSMMERLEICEVLPTAESFTVRTPRGSMFLNEDVDIDSIFLEDLKLKTTDILHDKIMYPAFLAYLSSIYSSENLLCARAISTYKCIWHDHVGPLGPLESPEGASDHAWKIYMYFVAVGDFFLN